MKIGQKVIYKTYAGLIDGVINEISPSGKLVKIAFPDHMMQDTGWIYSDAPEIVEIIDP
jgi:hypothetical protein